MFYPMAFTVLAALLGAMILSVTFVPAAVSVFVTGRLSERENPLVAGPRGSMRQLFAPRSPTAPPRPSPPPACWCVSGRHGHSTGQRVPAEPRRRRPAACTRCAFPGTSLTTAVEMQHALERKLKTYPEVDYVFSKIGTAEIATDPMPPSVADTYVMLKRPASWPDPQRTKASTSCASSRPSCSRVPGNNYEFTQPIQMRFNELIAGVRSDVAVKVLRRRHGDAGGGRSAASQRRSGVPGHPTSSSSRRRACRSSPSRSIARRWHGSA